MTTERWAATLLHRLGIPQTTGALRALVGWAHAEGGHWHNSARHNPLNTTQSAPGAGNTGTQGNIKSYRDWQQGLDATVQTLRNGRYGGILAALKHGDANGVASAIAASPWGTSGALVRHTIGSAPQSRQTQPVRFLNSSVTPGKAPRLNPGGTTTDNAGAIVAALLDPHKSTSLLDRFHYQLGTGKFTTTTPSTVTPGKSPRYFPGQESSGAPTASGTADFEGTKVAAWIKPALVYARQNGWKGKVTSGFRSRADQTRIYNSGVRPAAKPGTSNHEATEFPRGAVDVSDAAELSRILRGSRYGRRLRWAGAKDPVHFSHPHGGSY